MARRTALPSLDQSERRSESSATSDASQSRPPEFHTSGAPSISSRRVTRSAARLAAEPPSTNTDTPPVPAATPARKRKAPASRERASNESQRQPSPPRRSKRAKLAPPSSQAAQPAPQGGRRPAAMSQSGSPSKPTEDTSKPAASSSSSRRRTSRSKKPEESATSPTQTSPPRRQRKNNTKTSSSRTRKDAEDNLDDDTGDDLAREEDLDASPGDNNDGSGMRGLSEGDDGDPFRSAMFGPGSSLGLHSTLRALTGMMSGVSSRLRDILSNLRMKDDPSIQLIALQELSDLLLVSNEDSLAGHFAADAYVKELVTLMQPSETGEENPEIMLLACRCLANLMEAIRGSVASVVYGGAVPILCQKLLDIQFIDLAEQALSTLAKISVDFPASIVRAGGLTACLTYLDFFPTSTQRTAVTTAANCCRNLPPDSFPVVRDVMPTLLNVLSSNDQKVVEQGCICVSRVVESFKYKPDKLEVLIQPEMLRAILRLLLPGTTNLIGPHIHTQLLRVLAITCRSSPRLSVELLKMDVVDTLYQILTGVSPPSDVSNSPIKVDSVHIMQALIHRPREQVYETLNVVCEILPGVGLDDLVLSNDDLCAALEIDILTASKSPKAKAAAKKRQSLLKGCQPQLKRFATILLPTLTDTYASTVNLGVRQKVLIAQVKMLQDIDAPIVADALRAVPYASFLAAILSQKDHNSLVALALQCARLLFNRLEDIYQYQFHREGVISEVAKLAETPLSKDSGKMDVDTENAAYPEFAGSGGTRQGDQELDEDHDMEDDESQEDDDYNDDYHGDNPDDDISDSDSASSRHEDNPFRSLDKALQDLVTKGAKEFLRSYEGSNGGTMRDKASEILESLRKLVTDIENSYLNSQSNSGPSLFRKLATYFDADALDSITSAELLNSGVIDTLLNVIGDDEGEHHRPAIRICDELTTDANNYAFQIGASNARTDFLRAFMGTNVPSSSSNDKRMATPFGILIHKLHDLLSRTEHFEVMTVNHSSLENRSAALMLSKQLRLRLIADEKSEIPKTYRNMMVSIHAIANFKALDDYLRPRISLSERPRASKHRIPSPPSYSARIGGGGSTSSSALGSSALSPPEQSMASGASRDMMIPDRTREQATSGESQDRPRRSRRGQHQPPPPAEESSEKCDAPLECADERHVSDDNDEEEEEEDALDAIVDDLEDDMSDDGAQDPTAVNLEVGSGGTVTARKEDGSQVATPLQSTPTSRPSASTADPTSRALGQAFALAGRSFSSYAAAAMTSMPQDWHIEFEIDGKPMTNDTTIYRAIHHNRENISDSPNRNVWSMVHTVKFKRVPGPPPPEPSTLTPSSSSLPEDDDGETMPESLKKNPITSSILRLLRVLHRLNSQFDDILDASKETLHMSSEPLTQFINTKLTAKLNRQLEEPLIVASNCLPGWSEDLARHFPFLFPFETRHLFLQSTSFGYARSIMRWQGSQNGEDNRRERRDDRPFPGRLQKQKVRISRNRFLDSAMKVLELYGASPSVLEVEYFEEVGTGLGPTLEFYSTVSKEFCKKKLKLWRDDDPTEGGDYVVSKLGLFPSPMTEPQTTQDAGKKQLQHFKSLGKFVARSMLDSRIIDMPFNPAFFRVGNSSSGIMPSIGTVKLVDPYLANSLMTLKRFANKRDTLEDDTSLSFEEKAQALENCRGEVEDLALDFTLPGYPHINLVPDGSKISLTLGNVQLYISKVIDMTLGSGVKAQIDAFRTGFSQVFRYSSLKAFTPSELVMLFGQVDEDWSIETLMDSIKADHGFNMDSRSVRNLLDTMSQFTVQQRRDFLQFVTGSPKLPIGGFKNLTPMFTVVCRPSEPPYTPDDYLPSVMTCVNYLKLPDYSSPDTLRERLGVAMREGQGAFHLS